MTTDDTTMTTETVRNINAQRQAALRELIDQAEREPTHWVIRFGYHGGRFTTWLGFLPNGDPVGEWAPERARQYLSEAGCYAIARRARNKAGERGEVVTYLQALRDELEAVKQRENDFQEMVAELKAQAGTE